ncbi:MAG: methionine synthase [Spirochaetales bacterium]|nr:methionine synthase [Spirochaetales bacterium]
MTFKERLSQGVVLFDGAMGTQIHALDPTDEEYQGKLGCSEILNITIPDKIQGIHRAYLEAGSDVIETNTFGSSTIVLAEYAIADQAREISRAGARLAREAADEFSTDARPRFVAGSVGPGTKLISLGQTTWAQMYESYREQIGGLLEGAADALILETCQDPLQIKCAMVAAEDEMTDQDRRVPIIVSFTVETTGTLLVGTEVQSILTTLEPYDLVAIGMNCATGPENMKAYVRQICETVHLPVIVQPNAGLPQNVGGQMVYTLEIDDYVKAMMSFVDDEGVGIVGGCCGTTPEFIRALADALGENHSIKKRNPVVEPGVSSLFSAQTLTQEPPPFYIGERTNTNGSKLFREALLSGDFDTMMDIARDQVTSGVHGLDVCVAYTGRDEVEDMTQTLRRMVTQVTLPLVIDSTEYPVLENALQMYGGRGIINSINLEDGEPRADKICRLAKRYGAALIALTIDETGMAREVDHKITVAKRIYDIAVNRHGLKPSDLIYDPLTFTLGSGDESMKDAGIKTLEGIRAVKDALPGVRTVLGLSNISFGLNPGSRKVLNSVFLSRAVEAGLDMAIVNLSHIVPLASLDPIEVDLAENLIYDRGEGNPLFKFIEYFEAKKGGGSEKDTGPKIEDLPLEERIPKKIIQGSKSKVEEWLHEAMDAGWTPIGIINELLIPAMKVVGDLFGDGRMQLPFVLQSAETMKYSVDILQPYMEKVDSQEQTTIVLGTVRGDVHDIGKNLVEIILSNNGYRVFNLGIKCEIETMIQKAQEVGAHAIGMSGLLVKSTVVMKDNLEELQRRGMDIPVLLGGAALTPGYVWDICGPLYRSPVVYCADAFEGLNAMSLIKEGKLEQFMSERAEKRAKKEAVRRTRPPEEVPPLVIRRDIAIPTPPFLGTKVIESVRLDEVYPYLTEEVLFRGRWGYRRGKLSKEEYVELIEGTVRPQFEELKARCKAEKLLNPTLVYGYWECQSEGDDVILYKPHTNEELSRFTFPRQPDPPHQCISDYFYSVESGKKDIFGQMIVTVGERAQKESEKLYEGNHYKDYLLFHGLSVETAEALTEYWHLQMRKELEITEEDGQGISDFVVQKYRGSRYSFGYPACPDLSGNRRMWELLSAERIGVSMSEEDQMYPEQSVSAFVVHHPQAKYFNS